jgi:ketosteroid isomerase-like protein
MKILSPTILSLFLLFVVVACSKRNESVPQRTFEYGEHRDSLRLEVQNAFMAAMYAFNKGNLNDSATFSAFRSFYDSTFVVFGQPGSPPVSGTTVLDTLRRFVQHHKPHLFISLDRIEVSQNLAYILYHYRETASDSESGRIVLDGSRSACMVLKKDSNGNWKCVSLTWA